MLLYGYMPRLNVEKLETAEQTGAAMLRYSLDYSGDLGIIATYSPFEIFDFLASLPYREDPEDVEFLMRPYYTVRGLGAGGDCDDKAIAVGAWAFLNGYPFRFVAVSRSKQKPLHHVFAEVNFGGSGFTSMDCTYADNFLGQVRYEAKRLIIAEYRP